jgi:hypothetical protein
LGDHQEVGYLEIDQMDASISSVDLKVSPENRLEVLKSDRPG